MKFAGPEKWEEGKGPIRMEPVQVRVQMKRPGPPTVHILDYNGTRTGRTVPVQSGAFTLDGAETRTSDYEIAY